MKIRYLYHLLTLFFLSSCSIHQYFTYSSELPKNDSGAFFDENDSLSFLYSFMGDKTIRFQLENKTNKLIYVDWDRSSLIFNNESIPFTDELSKLEGTGRSTQYIKGSTAINFEGTISESSSKTFVPPGSKISRLFTRVPMEYMNDLKKTHPFDEMLLPASAKKFAFSESNSVSKIRSFIFIGSSDESKVQQFNHSFWMSEVVETSVGNLSLRENQLRKSKKTGTGAVLGAVGSIVILAIAYSDPDEY